MTKVVTTYVGSLLDEELLLLDGKCVTDGLQAKVDAAKRRREAALELPDMAPADVAFVSACVDEVRAKGRLVWRYKQINRCDICGTSPGYAKLTRSSGRGRKGDPDTRRRLSIQGVELADRFITFQGSVTLGGCVACVTRLAPVAVKSIGEFQCELPEKLTGFPPRWKRHERRTCKECSWTGGQNEMGQLPALMGGYYPGRCPKCGAESRPFGPTVFELAPGFTVTPAGSEAVR